MSIDINKEPEFELNETGYAVQIAKKYRGAIAILCEVPIYPASTKKQCRAIAQNILNKINNHDKLIEALKADFDLIKGLAVIFYKELQTKSTPGNMPLYPIIKLIIENNLALLQSIEKENEL